MTEAAMVIHRGGCHCGAVRFEVTAPASLEVDECNCSICAMTGFLHLIVPQGRFRLLKGGEDLVTYTFNTQVAQHYFCRHCGIKSFYVPRSNPDGYSVNARCLEPQTILGLRIALFDDTNREAADAAVQHRSRE
jgi:hypothetical protein